MTGASTVSPDQKPIVKMSRGYCKKIQNLFFGPEMSGYIVIVENKIERRN